MPFGPEGLAARLSSLVPGFPSCALAVAASGGADSAALLHALATLARTHPALAVRALHVDHGLQPAAAPLRAAALAVAAAAGVPATVLRVSVAPDDPHGLEAAARAARYAALARALAPGESLLTAHHREDQAETVLLQLLRGGGLPGLAAMPAVAGLGDAKLVRPLLDVGRAELVDYARAQELPWVEDPMNADPRYDRAWLRRELWPPLTARWPAAATTLARAARHAQEAQSLIDEVADQDLATLVRAGALDVAGLLALVPARRNAALRRWLRVAGVRPPPARRLARLEPELLRSAGPNGPRLAWDGVELRRFDGRLHLVRPLPDLPAHAALGPDRPAALGTLGRLTLRPVVGAGLAAARTALPLDVRPRRGGECLRLATGGARRAVKDLLREARVPPWLRERLPLLWDGDRLVAVAHPGGAWIAAEARAAAGEPGHLPEWESSPPGLGA